MKTIKTNCYRKHKTGTTERIGMWVLVPINSFADRLTLLQSRGAQYAHHIFLSPPRFFDIPAALLKVQKKSQRIFILVIYSKRRNVNCLLSCPVENLSSLYLGINVENEITLQILVTFIRTCHNS